MSDANRVAVFDLDGTMIDSIPDVIGAMNRLLAEEGRPPVPVADGRRMIGEGAGKLLERGFAATGSVPDAAALAALNARYQEIYNRFPVVETTIFPGVVEVLDTLSAAGIPLGVCTNKTDESSALVLDALGLAGYFGSVIGGDALDVRKPDGRHLLAVIERLGGNAAHAVYVGDSPTDAETAHDAGVPFIAVSYGYSRVAPEAFDAYALIDHFSKVPAALARVWDDGTMNGSPA